MLHFKSDPINNMEHMPISGTKPSSVILRKKKFEKLVSDVPKVPNKLKPKVMM